MTASRAIIWGIVIATIVIVASAGAVVVINSMNQGATGKVSIFIQDKPEKTSANFTYLNVTYSAVEIHQSGAGNDSGWVTLSMVTQTVDLKALSYVSQLLASGNVPPGNYTQIRLTTSIVQGVMTNGTAVMLKVPSGVLKIIHPFNVSANGNKSITIDIDLDDSIVHAGNEWIFTPVLGEITDQ